MAPTQSEYMLLTYIALTSVLTIHIYIVLSAMNVNGPLLIYDTWSSYLSTPVPI